MAEGENFREQVTVRMEPDGTRRVRGKLEAITVTSLILRNDRGKIAIDRTAVHSVRLGRKPGNPFRMRIVGAALMFPMWFVGVASGSLDSGRHPGRPVVEDVANAARSCRVNRAPGRNLLAHAAS